MNFLDKTGFQYFWNKLKSYVSTQIDNIPEAGTHHSGLMSIADKQTLDNLNYKLQGVDLNKYFKEGNVYTTDDKTVALDLQHLRDAKLWSCVGEKVKAAIIGHFHSDVKTSKFSVIYQDGTPSFNNPLVIETVPCFGILLGMSKKASVDYYIAGEANYSTYIGRGTVAVSDSQKFSDMQTGKRVQLTSKGYRPVDKQGNVIINDTWAKNNMNNIATCDATMVDAKVIDIDYDHKIATVRITVQDTEGQFFYVKTRGMVIGGTISSAVDGEYYANVVLQVPYDSSGKVSLYDKYAITW